MMEHHISEIDVEHANELLKLAQRLSPDTGAQLTAIATTMVVMCKRRGVDQDNLFGVLDMLFHSQFIFDDDPLVGHA